MDKSELEEMLLDPDMPKKLSEWAINFRQAHGLMGASKESNSQIKQTVQLPHETRPSIEEIKTNYRRIEKYFFLASIQQFIPELTNKSPREALEFLTSRYRENPSTDNLYMVVDAINRLTASRDPTEKLQPEQLHKTITETFKLLGSERKKKSESDDIWCYLCEHADFGGRVFSAYLEPGWIYWSQPQLRSYGFNDITSSIGKYSSEDEEIGANIILFEHNRFFGRYASFFASRDVIDNISYVGDFNDLTSSFLIVRRFANELPASPISRFISKDQILDFVRSQQDIWPSGDPILTWDMWPVGPTSRNDWHPNSPDKAYLYIKIPIMVHTPWPFSNYHAEVHYWIYLYVGSEGKLRGYVDYYGAWVEGGIIHNDVMNGLMGKLPGTLGTVNEFIAKATSLVNALGSYRFVYFLPGRGANEGTVDEDVTIVLAKR